MCEECPIFVGNFDDIENDAKSLIIVVYFKFWFDCYKSNFTYIWNHERTRARKFLQLHEIMKWNNHSKMFRALLKISSRPISWESLQQILLYYTHK